MIEVEVSVPGDILLRLSVSDPGIPGGMCSIEMRTCALARIAYTYKLYIAFGASRALKGEVFAPSETLPPAQAKLSLRAGPSALRSRGHPDFPEAEASLVSNDPSEEQEAWGPD